MQALKRYSAATPSAAKKPRPTTRKAVGALLPFFIWRLFIAINYIRGKYLEGIKNNATIKMIKICSICFFKILFSPT
jgi:hypothetical protein